MKNYIVVHSTVRKGQAIYFQLLNWIEPDAETKGFQPLRNFPVESGFATMEEIGQLCGGN